MRCRPSVMPFVVLALLSGVAVLPASAETSDPTAGQLAEALASGSNVITGAEYIEGPPSSQATLVGTEPIAGFPREGNSFALLSTGAAADAYLPNNQGNPDLGLRQDIDALECGVRRDRPEGRCHRACRG